MSHCPECEGICHSWPWTGLGLPWPSAEALAHLGALTGLRSWHSSRYLLCSPPSQLRAIPWKPGLLLAHLLDSIFGPSWRTEHCIWKQEMSVLILASHVMLDGLSKHTLSHTCTHTMGSFLSSYKARLNEKGSRNSLERTSNPLASGNLVTHCPTPQRWPCQAHIHIVMISSLLCLFSRQQAPWGQELTFSLCL